MRTVPYKAKQYLLASAKALILAVTFGYIIYKLNNHSKLGLSEFIFLIHNTSNSFGNFILLFLGLTAANWFFEILKWQALVSTIEKINFKSTLKQCLASFTVSLATPSRIGEYGAKVLFFDKQYRKKVLLLNFFSGGAQMFVTIIFGAVGLIYFFQNFNINYIATTLGYFVIGIILIFGIGYYLKEKELLLKGFTIAKTIKYFKNIPLQIKMKVIVFSFLRYVIFSGMFYCLLLFFGANIVFNQAILLIFSMYLLVSILPTLFIFDIIIRGGVAVWVFSFNGVPEIIVLSTVLAMWLFNFVLPSLLGSFYVLTYQPATR